MVAARTVLLRSRLCAAARIRGRLAFATRANESDEGASRCESDHNAPWVSRRQSPGADAGLISQLPPCAAQLALRCFGFAFEEFNLRARRRQDHLRLQNGRLRR